MIAPVDLVEVDEVGVGLLGPAPRRLVELSREDAHRCRNRDALDVEEAERVLPVEAPRGHPGVRQPRERDVVEDLVPGEVVDRVAVEAPRDVLVAEQVVVEHPGGEGDGGVGEPVQRLRVQRHLGRVADALRVEEVQPLPRAGLVGRQTGRRRVAGRASSPRPGAPCRACSSGCRASSGGALAPITSVIWAPQSPPCATNRGVSESPHELDPGIRDVDGTPAGLGRLSREPVTGHRRNHDVERVRCVAAVRRRVGERPDRRSASRRPSPASRA